MIMKCFLFLTLLLAYQFNSSRSFSPFYKVIQNDIRKNTATLHCRIATKSCTFDDKGNDNISNVVNGASNRAGEIKLMDETYRKAFFKAVKNIGAAISLCFLLGSPAQTIADDELAKYAAEGNKVGVDGQCFFKKCALETSACANDPNCLKGLSCLARCKGGSMCSTGCFAKYGSERLDNLLACSVEKHDCVQVPGKGNEGWIKDEIDTLPSKPVQSFELSSLQGQWYKVMGLDSRYDCFDCQKNTFQKKDKSTLKMEALFRIPRPTSPGYLQNRILEELVKVNPSEEDSNAHMKSKGQMFGLTFWENWYVIGEKGGTNPFLNGLGVPAARAGDSPTDMKLIYYTGHTLQGSYKGAFLYSRTKDMTPELLEQASTLISDSGLNPNDFCVIRNQCFTKDKDGSSLPTRSVFPSADASTISDSSSGVLASVANSQSKFDDDAGNSNDYPFWYLGQQFFSTSRGIANELADWFGDPTIVSDWLVEQQEHMVFRQPLEVSPFASLVEKEKQ